MMTTMMMMQQLSYFCVACDTDVAGSAVRRDTPATSGDHRASVLFQTRFKNNTKADQSYTMRTEKKTRTSMSTSVEHGFTKGIEMGVSLKTPCEVKLKFYRDQFPRKILADLLATSPTSS